MNSTYQSRQGSAFTVSYPDFPGFTTVPQNFRLYEEAGKQDVMEITYPYSDSFYTKVLKTGVPLHVKWRNDSVSGEFFGYVYDSLPRTAQGMNRRVVVRAIGASLGLKQGEAKIWTNRTVTEVVEEIAKKFKLKPNITPHPLRLSQITMTSHSYWEKIQELARKIGYVAQVSGTDLYFHPIDNMINQFMTVVPVLSFEEAETREYSGPVSHTLDTFEPHVGDLSSGEMYSRKDKVIHGIDPLTAKPYTTTSSPNEVGKNLRSSTKESLFQEVLSSSVSASPAVAEMIAEAHANLSGFSILAEGTGQGNPNIAPYRTIEINGTGNTTDGYWVIKKVEHFITWDGRYSVDFTCMTDGTGPNKASAFRPLTASTVPVRNIAHELTTGISSKPTSTRISGPSTMINETQSGYKITPRRWEGR
jgi:phage protein D